jgi:hypothetical protein
VAARASGLFGWRAGPRGGGNMPHLEGWSGHTAGGRSGCAVCPVDHRCRYGGCVYRWMTVIAFALGMAACTAYQRGLGGVYGPTPGAPRLPGSYVALATVLGVVMLVAGIAAFMLASGTMLATLVAAMVALWLLATGRHAVAGRHLHLPACPATRQAPGRGRCGRPSARHAACLAQQARMRRESP